MGHSSLAVSLTYLRGLEVCDLDGEDMPQLILLLLLWDYNALLEIA